MFQVTAVVLLSPERWRAEMDESDRKLRPVMDAAATDTQRGNKAARWQRGKRREVRVILRKIEDELFALHTLCDAW
ncbi:hypothetical protein PBY51_011396 [Eleginops maclovinus]|uniref:Uncharacterized protein n=1 Tax=Eleginops maclovinus TaxID=56733 RepID=A0AAN7XRA2_ELEMC|nr:hypothetical protein PBY51_011396 [Eleginops maclovinus]